ncbi:MAG TPA: molybdopterin-dependent oxidoreductase, partial [Solirubrobacterales bacterium]|nr:molybdopterin-dependent oxidoreductase [Solirubrobacterales bacterium]
VCTLCPSQCNVSFTVRDEQVKRVIARDNPDVDDGWLCDRGRYGFEMFNAEERMTEPRLRGGVAATWEDAIAKAADALRAASVDHTGVGTNLAAASGGGGAAIVGDASNEEGYLIQRIMREALGSPHVDSRPSRGPSRETLVRLAQPEITAKVRDIDDADAILVVGTDPLHSSPILDLRIRKAIRRNGAKLAVATEAPTALDGGAAAVARYAPGNAGTFLAELAASLGADGPISQGDLDVSAHRQGVAGMLWEAKSVVVVWGDRIGREGDGAIAALLDVASTLDLTGKNGAGLLEVAELTNARGLREAGCLPDAGPGLTRAPFGSHTSPNGASTGKATEEIRAALESGELKTVLLFGVDPLRDFPNTEAWKNALAKADHVICFSMFENATTTMADIVFPLETHAEKDGTVTHPDGRLQRVRPSASRPGDIRPGWGVLAEIALALGHDTGISSQPSAFAALTEAVPFYAGITDSDIGGRGIRWQDAVPEKATGPGSPDTQPDAPTPPAATDPAPRGVASAEPGPVAHPDGALALSTYRDLWAGPITELNPPLRFLQPQQRVELSVPDAEKLGLSAGDEVSVSQNGTSLRARVAIRERVPEGTCLLLEGTAEDNANALLNGAPVSVRIEKTAAP